MLDINPRREAFLDGEALAVSITFSREGFWELMMVGRAKVDSYGLSISDNSFLVTAIGAWSISNRLFHAVSWNFPRRESRVSMLRAILH